MPSEIMLHQSSDDERFSGVAQDPGRSGRNAKMPQKIGRGGGNNYAGQDRPSRNGPERDQEARGNTRGGPEDDRLGSDQKTVA
jgi:hypothetical protein